jgi:hypothetical protein
LLDGKWLFLSKQKLAARKGFLDFRFEFFFGGGGGWHWSLNSGLHAR